MTTEFTTMRISTRLSGSVTKLLSGLLKIFDVVLADFEVVGHGSDSARTKLKQSIEERPGDSVIVELDERKSEIDIQTLDDLQIQTQVETSVFNSRDSRISDDNTDSETDSQSSQEISGNHTRRIIRPGRDRKIQIIKVSTAINNLARFGRVYLARENQSKRLFAIKAAVKDNTILSMQEFFQEQQFLKKMKHKFVANLTAPWRHPRTISWLWTTIAEAICSLSLYWHWITLIGKKIVFRDLKIENIVVDSEGHIKVVDFGAFAMCYSSAGVSGVVGTIPYLAPEVAENISPYTYTADYWSLGAVIYNLTARTLPYSNDTNDVSDFLEQVENNEVVYVSDFFSSECKHLCMRLMEPNPLLRY
ncbi:Serine/threonine-protein kinase 32A [Nowakowskiella sp. JEL0407]|nr:Serine/threonine-protein kinase 32A [Nowakowskiella sp. JEL0407]